MDLINTPMPRVSCQNDENSENQADQFRTFLHKKRVVNHLELILQTLDPFRDQIKGFVVESTFNWYWLVDGLMDGGHRVHLANPNAMRQYDGLKFADDCSDARWLAHMLRIGVLPEGYILFKERRHAEAAKVLAEAVATKRLGPERQHALLYLGKSLHEAKQEEEAIVMLEALAAEGTGSTFEAAARHTLNHIYNPGQSHAH